MTDQIRTWSRRQWEVAGKAWLAALVVMGAVGQTLPIASSGRVVPLEWWNYVTLAISPVLIGFIAATLVPTAQPKRAQRLC